MNLLNSELYRSALERICAGIDLDFLQGRTVLVTGASGMLGSCLVDLLSVWNQTQASPCRIIAMGRNQEAASQRFGPVWGRDLFFVPGAGCLR